LRIGITGAPGSGKTALAVQLSKRLGIPLIRDQAHQAAKVAGIDLGIVQNRRQEALEFQKAVLISQLALEDIYKSFVTDTTTIGCLAHWRMLDGNRNRADKIYRKWCLEKTDYNQLIYLPPGLELNSFVYKLDREITCVLQEMEKPFIMACGTLEDRLDIVLSVLKNQGKETGSIAHRYNWSSRRRQNNTC